MSKFKLFVRELPLNFEKQRLCKIYSFSSALNFFFYHPLAFVMFIFAVHSLFFSLPLHTVYALTSVLSSVEGK